MGCGGTKVQGAGGAAGGSFKMKMAQITGQFRASLNSFHIHKPDHPLNIFSRQDEHSKDTRRKSKFGPKNAIQTKRSDIPAPPPPSSPGGPGPP